jgi:hypothetical protein
LPDESRLPAKSLPEIVGAVRLLARGAAVNVLHIGSHLLDARRLLGPRFAPWVTEQFGWTPAAAVRMMRVAAAFQGVRLVDRFEAGALYALSAPGAPPEARRSAVAAAAQGEKVTAQAARSLIAAARPAARPAPQAGKARPGKERIDPDDRPQAEDRTLELLAWAAVESLVAAGASVRVGRLGTLDDDDPAGRPYSCHVYRDGAEPVVTHSKDSAASAVTLAAGTQPRRTCKACGDTHPVFDGFSRKQGNPLGRSHNCRRCETFRVGESKKLKRGTWKEGDADPTRPPSAPSRRPAGGERPSDSPAGPPGERRTPPGG